MAIAEFIGARDRLRDAIAGEADMGDALQAAMAALHAVTRFSWAAVLSVDPQTLLPTGGVVEGFDPEVCAPFWDNELLAPGYNKFTALARSTDPVATLVDATDGDLQRAPNYTELYEPLGVADELRAAFVLGKTCWGVAVLVRAEADGPFPDAEVDHVRALAPLIARALKTGACKPAVSGLGSAAMIVLDANNQLQSYTAGAGELLDDLRHVGDTAPDPRILSVLATRARASRTTTHLATRVRGCSGRWVRITAAPMEGGDGSVAVMIEPARAADLTPILLESYGLTTREAEIVVLLARGLATKEIAAELALSPHTVRDHVKAIYDKAGVNSRGELVANLFNEHLIDAFEAATHRV